MPQTFNHCDTAICKEVIISTIARRGNGTTEPIRIITQVFEKDGSLIAEKDPIQKNNELDELKEELNELGHGLEKLKEYIHKLEEENKQLKEKQEQTNEIFKWLMGVPTSLPDFPEKKVGDPAFYWRTFLRTHLEKLNIKTIFQ